MNLKKTNARIASVKLCYQKQKLGNSQLGEAILMQKMKKELFQEEQEYAQEMLAFLQKNQTRIDNLIQKHLKHWRQNRLQTVINSILRLAITEKFLHPKLAKNIILNEFLEITRMFSEEKSVAFCNGVLSNALSEIESKRAQN